VVHLLRHGEVYNPGRILYGRLPGFHLSEEGRLMAKAATGFLAGRDVVLLRSSPLDRAQETAAPLAAQFGLEVDIDERLIESTNRYEGTTFGRVLGVAPPGGLALPVQPFGHPGADISPSPPGCSRPGPTRRGRREATRWSASATSCPSGPPAGPSRGSICGTTPATGSAHWLA
jgi:hypothetical protein